MSALLLMRHGESVWNAEDRFAGWVDIPLSDVGRTEALRAGAQLVQAGLLPDVMPTSVLRRAILRAALAADACERHWIPVRRSWRLNERHYGSLQGERRTDVLAAVGERRFDTWRRSYDATPPPIDDDAYRKQLADARYAAVPRSELPHAESLADVTARLLPYWTGAIEPDLMAGRNVLVVAHGNSLRALIRHVDGLSDSELMRLEIPTGVPLVYKLDLAP